MNKLGLRERLLLLYALMALVPVIAAGSWLYFYLGGQVAESSRQLHDSMQRELRLYQDALEIGTQAVLREAHLRMRRRTTEQLLQQRAQMQSQQTALLREAVAEVQTTTRNALQQIEQATLSNLQHALQQVEQQVQGVQMHSLATLQAATEQATRDALQQTITQHLAQLSAQLSRQVESLLRNYTAQLTLIAQQPAIQNGDTTEARWILQALQNREPAYQLLALLNAEGELVLTISEEIDPATVQADWQALWHSMQTTQDTLWGNARLYRIEGRLQPFVPILTPVRYLGKEFRGAIFALVSLDEVSNLTRAFRIGERGIAMLVQHDGLILAHPDSRQIGQVARAFQHLLRSALQPYSTVVPGESELLVAIAPVRRLHARLVITQPTEEAFQLVESLRHSLQQVFAAQQAQTQQAINRASVAAKQQFRTQVQQQQAQIRQRIHIAEQRSLTRSVASLNALSRAQQQRLAQMIDESFRQTRLELERGLRKRLAEAYLRTNAQLQAITETMRYSVNHQVRTSLSVALMCIIAALGIGAVYFHRSLVRPLRILVEAAHDIAAGNMNRRVGLPRRGCPELDDLADSFNHMVDAVQKAEAQLIQSSKLASLGTLASGVAHELNQPLAIIRAIAQQTIQDLSAEASEPFSPTRHQALLDDMRLIERQTIRMSQIIQHLRAFARKPREEFEPVNLNEVAQNALILLREQLRNRGITLVENYTPDLPSVLGEPNSLEQIVINLLTNARDALEDRPNAQIVVETGTYDDGKQLYAELRVRDNGPGVPPDIRTQIFDPFFTTKDPNKGTGLGLAISLEIAHKHHGTLLLADTTEGAEFVLRIPVAAQNLAAA